MSRALPAVGEEFGHGLCCGERIFQNGNDCKGDIRTALIFGLAHDEGFHRINAGLGRSHHKRDEVWQTPVLFVKVVFHDVPDSEVLFQERRFGEIVAINLVGMLGFQAQKASCAVLISNTKGAVAVVVVYPSVSDRLAD